MIRSFTLICAKISPQAPTITIRLAGNIVMWFCRYRHFYATTTSQFCKWWSPIIKLFSQIWPKWPKSWSDFHFTWWSQPHLSSLFPPQF